MSDPELTAFLLRACHDLRTPLRAVLAHSELLTNRSNGDLEPSLGFVVDNSRKASRLVEGLADYAVARGTDPAEFRSTPLGVLLRIALAKLDPELREYRAEVTYDSLPAVPVNADRLVQLFEHLLRNALRHRGPADPRIHIAAERQPEAWLITVRDNGPGVEAEFLERIFEPFFKLTVGEEAGAGLGLASCRAILEKHGGTAWAESEPGGGCSILFTLPAE